MGTSRNRRIKQAQEVKEKVKAPYEGGPSRCAVFLCPKPTPRSLGKGLDDTLCATHRENLRRCGHESRKSYTAAELKPYREAARRWLRLHKDDPYLTRALSSIESLMSSQGRAKDAYEHRAMPPRKKSLNVLAKLRDAGKTPEQIMEIVLATKATQTVLGPRGAPEWVPVQIAKAVKRMRGASGTHWRNYGLRSRYPRSEGGYLRHLGRMIEDRAAHAIDSDTIEEVKALVPRRTP